MPVLETTWAALGILLRLIRTLTRHPVTVWGPDQQMVLAAAQQGVSSALPSGPAHPRPLLTQISLLIEASGKAGESPPAGAPWGFGCPASLTQVPHQTPLEKQLPAQYGVLVETNHLTQDLSLIHISEPTRRKETSRMPSSA